MNNQPSMDDQVLGTIREWIIHNIGNEDFIVPELAKESGFSRSLLHRKLIRLTGKSVTELITEIRLERARELLESLRWRPSIRPSMTGWGSGLIYTFPP